MIARPRPDSGSRADRLVIRAAPGPREWLRTARAGGAAVSVTAGCPRRARRGSKLRRRNRAGAAPTADSALSRCTASLPGSKPRPLSSTSTRQPLRSMLATTS